MPRAANTGRTPQQDMQDAQSQHIYISTSCGSLQAMEPCQLHRLLFLCSFFRKTEFMGKRKGQLPSGNVRVQVYDYTDENGKKHYKSFTAASRSEAMAMANEWKQNRRQLKENMTVKRACERYIALKSGVLSPVSINGYNECIRRISRYKISDIALKQISNTDIQEAEA